MNWKEKILVGMELIAEACAANESWSECIHCPFDGLCDELNNMRRERSEEFASGADIFNEEIKWYRLNN